MTLVEEIPICDVVAVVPVNIMMSLVPCINGEIVEVNELGDRLA